MPNSRLVARPPAGSSSAAGSSLFIGWSGRIRYPLMSPCERPATMCSCPS